MREIVVLPPIKSGSRYEFRYSTHNYRQRSVQNRTKSLIKRNWPSCPLIRLKRAGIVAKNLTLSHSDLWDSVFPLLLLTRNGGPLYKSGCKQARIIFKYPILETVRNFYIRRSADLGIEVSVEADTYDRTFSIPTIGHALPVGGGKDGRLIYGILRELGRKPTPYHATSAIHPRLPDVDCLEVEPLAAACLSAAIGALMSPCQVCYYGSSLNDIVFNTPWQQYFDMTPEPLADFSALLDSLGLHKLFAAPLAPLPSNLVQRILAARYPHLYRHQRSVPKDATTEKNLHISLLEVYHGLNFESHCSPHLFRQLLKDFVHKSLIAPDDNGYRNGRKLDNAEMKAIIFRTRDEPLFDEVRDMIPDSWDANWIDCVHPSADPNVDEEFLDIYREYASVAAPKVTMAITGKDCFAKEGVHRQIR